MRVNNLDIVTLLGEVDLSYDSGNIELDEKELELFVAVLDVQKQGGDVFFYDVYRSLLKMIGINEFDKYRNEGLEEFLLSETEFGKAVGIENKNMSKALYNAGFRLTKDNQLIHLNTLQEQQSSEIYLSNLQSLKQ